ncbi:unknown protein [Nostoc sp. NIES-3756]|nr:unknown protein [Nostoc sp. NIES-3756]
MVTTLRHNSKPSRYLLYSLAFILSFLLCLPWVSAKEKPKPQPQAWQINSIVAALDDGYDQVKEYALSKLVEYDLQKLKFVNQKPEYFANKAAQILKDEKVASGVRYRAAVVLGNLGDAAKPYVKDILDILKDKSVDNSVRYGAAVALGNLGDAAKPYVKDILDFLKDKSVDNSVRSRCSSGIGKSGRCCQTLRQRHSRHPQG